jgi:hypothetical protein
MNLYLSNLDTQSKFPNEERIRIFKETFDTVLTGMKIAKFLQPYIFEMLVYRIISCYTIFDILFLYHLP